MPLERAVQYDQSEGHDKQEVASKKLIAHAERVEPCCSGWENGPLQRTERKGHAIDRTDHPLRCHCIEGKLIGCTDSRTACATEQDHQRQNRPERGGVASVEQLIRQYRPLKHQKKHVGPFADDPSRS